MHCNPCPGLCHTARIALHASTCLLSLASWVKHLDPTCAFVGQHHTMTLQHDQRTGGLLAKCCLSIALLPQVILMSSSSYSTILHQHSPCSRRKVFNKVHSEVIIITRHDGTYSSPADSAQRLRACTTCSAPPDVSLSSDEGGNRPAYKDACHESFSHLILGETFMTG